MRNSDYVVAWFLEICWLSMNRYIKRKSQGSKDNVIILFSKNVNLSLHELSHALSVMFIIYLS